MPDARRLGMVDPIRHEKLISVAIAGVIPNG